MSYKKYAKYIDRGFFQITLKKLLKFAGGKNNIIKKFKNKHANQVYNFLMKTQDKMALDLTNKHYSEVGEESNTVIMDWVDNNFK